MYVITCDKIFSDRLRDVDSVGGSKIKVSYCLSQWFNMATDNVVLCDLCFLYNKFVCSRVKVLRSAIFDFYHAEDISSETAFERCYDDTN